MLIPRLRNDHGDLRRLALSLATLSAVGFSLVLCAQLSGMQLAARSSYTLSNVLGVPGRNLLLLSLGGGILTPALIGLSLYLKRGTLVLGALEHWATVLAPLALLFVVPGLFLNQVAEAKPLFYLVVLAAFGLAMRALLAASLRAHGARRAQLLRPAPARFYALRRWFGRLPKLRMPKAWALSFVLLLGCAFAYYFGHYAVARHRLIQTVDNDLGIVDNFMANVLHGSFRAPAQFGTTPVNYLSLHADYIALLFAPIYRLRPGVETLLWLQAALAALAIVPLFLLSARLLGQRMAVWVSVLYLLLSPLHAGLVYGFSWFPAFCLFSFTLYYAVLAERRWLLLFALPALLASTEAGPPAVFALGVFLATSRRKTALGLGLGAAAVLVFAFNTRLALRTGATQEPPLIAAGLTTLLNNPVYFILDLARNAKLTSILHTLSPLALLPLLAWSSLALLLPALLFTSASQVFWPASSALASFQFLWIPGSILSLLVVLQRLRSAPGKRPLFLASVAAISITLISHSYDFGLLLRDDALTSPSRSEQFKPNQADAKRYADLQSVIRKIPASASVVATAYMLPHVSSRKDVFDARRPYGKPDYVFFSTRELASTVKSALGATLSAHDYALVAHSEEFYLFHRAAETPETSAILRTLGLSDRL